MNPTLYTAVLICLGLILVTMYAVGCYWLADHDKHHHTNRPIPPLGSTSR